MIEPKKPLGLQQEPLHGLTAALIGEVLSTFIASEQFDHAAAEQFAELSEKSIFLRNVITAWADLLGVLPTDAGNLFFHGFLIAWRARVLIEQRQRNVSRS